MILGQEKYFSTQHVKCNEVRAYWNDHICNTYVKLSSTNINDKGFFGDISLSSVDELQISKIRSTKQTVYRTKQLIGQSSDECFFLLLQLSGVSISKQNGRMSKLNPNDWTLLDTTQPYELEFFGDFEQLVIKLPSTIFNYFSLTQLNKVSGKLFKGNIGNGQIAGTYFKSLYFNSKNVQGSTLGKTLSKMAVTLLVDCISLELLNHKYSPSNELMSLQVKSYVKEHLELSELSVNHLAKVFGCSSRYLHLTFEKEDTTIKNFINEQRLKKCKQYIEHPIYRSLSLSEICYTYGFNSLSHFSKLFKQKYGIAPRAYRNEVCENSITQTDPSL